MLLAQRDQSSNQGHDRYAFALLRVHHNLLPSFEDWVKGVLVQQYKSIVSQPNTSGWTMRKLDQSFGLGNASVRPIRLNGELVYWAKTKDIMVANQQVTVYAYYVYFLGVSFSLVPLGFSRSSQGLQNIYDLEPDPLYKDLSKTLIESIPGHVISPFSNRFLPLTLIMPAGRRYWKFHAR